MPIIKSLLDTDFYKFTMGQFVWKRYADVEIKYEFICRGDRENFFEFLDVPELVRQLDHARNLKFDPFELFYLRKLYNGVFSRGYLSFLESFSLPEYELSFKGGEFNLSFSGYWHEAIFWETIALSIISEVYNRLAYNYISETSLYSHGSDFYGNMERKIKDKFGNIPGTDIRFVDFGTRRRFSFAHHRKMLEKAMVEIPDNIVGTSNVYFARKYGLTPVGTFVHELPMVVAGLEGSESAIRGSHNRILEEWYEEYGTEFSIALTDTFGSDFFFRDFTPVQAVCWKGLRHDSGDPVEFGEKAISFYRGLGIDARTKTIVFSDGLDAEKICRIHSELEGRINCVFGWSTNFSSDICIPPISMVIKPVKASRELQSPKPLVKLSDNIAKAIGPADEIRRYQRIFGYEGN